MTGGMDALTSVLYAVGIGVAAVLSGISAYLTKKANKEIEDVNDAVNNRHKRPGGDGLPKLYDAVLHLHERSDKIDEKCDMVLNIVGEHKIAISDMAKSVKILQEACPGDGRTPCHWVASQKRQQQESGNESQGNADQPSS